MRTLKLLSLTLICLVAPIAGWAQDNCDFSNKDLKDRYTRLPDMDRYNRGNPENQYLVEIKGNKIKISYQGTLVEEIENGLAYLAYAENGDNNGGGGNILQISTVSPDKSFLFINGVEIRGIVPNFDWKSFSYFHTVMDKKKEEILFDFSKSGGTEATMGLYKKGRLCIGSK